MKPYRSQADQNLTRLPSGIPYIIVNEAAERFSYYGMRAILVIFMTHYLTDSSGQLAVLSEQEAQGYFHLFVSVVYLMPIFGALISDGVLGKYRTILILSLLYCFGHFALALDNTLLGLLVGQSLIAVGAGGIKPCVSAHVGDQFGDSNQQFIGKVFSWFYLAINFGAFAAMLIIPWLLERFGPSTAFGVPGILMLMATLAFWIGRYEYIHVKPAGMAFIKQLTRPEGIVLLLKLGSVYLFIAVFWALFEQIGSSWILQAQKMDRVIGGIELLPSQIQAANPLLIMLITPVLTYFIYPKIDRWYRLTPLRKMTIGLCLTVFAFSIASLIQMQIDQGDIPHIAWQLLAYSVLTTAEVMVSITCLEFSYRQAPKTMKSFVMGYFFLSVSLGNLFTSAVNFFIHNSDGTSKLEGASYFWFFTVLMFATTVLFVVSNRHRSDTSNSTMT